MNHLQKTSRYIAREEAAPPALSRCALTPHLLAAVQDAYGQTGEEEQERSAPSTLKNYKRDVQSGRVHLFRDVPVALVRGGERLRLGLSYGEGAATRTVTYLGSRSVRGAVGAARPEVRMHDDNINAELSAGDRRDQRENMWSNYADDGDAMPADVVAEHMAALENPDNAPPDFKWWRSIRRPGGRGCSFALVVRFKQTLEASHARAAARLDTLADALADLLMSAAGRLLQEPVVGEK